MSGTSVVPAAATVAVLLAVCAGLGHGILVVARRADRPWTGPAVGLAALLAAAPLLHRLPGRPATTAVILALLAGAGLWSARGLPRRPGAPWAAALALLVVLWLALPFYVNGRIGLLGQTVNDDTRFHLWWAELLGEGQAGDSIADGWYPLGPHTVVAALSRALGVGVDTGLDALLAVGPVVAGLAAMGAAAGLPRVRRLLVGVAVGIPYLMVSYYAQAAFKEVLLAAIVLAFAVQLRDEERGRGLDVRGGVVLGVLAAGGLATYTYVGLLWFAAVTGAAGAALVAQRILLGPREHGPWRREALRAVAGLAAAALVVGLTVAPQLADVLRSYEVLAVSPSGSGAIVTQNIGNLVSQLSVFEAFGQWPNDDFRFQPQGVLRDLMVVLGVGVAVYGGVWWLRRRDVAIPAAAAIVLAIFLAVRERESAYVSAKALVIASPLVVLTGATAIFAPAARPRAAASLTSLVALAFLAGLGYSSFLALRIAQVAPPAHAEELSALRPLVQGSSVLYLSNDNFSGVRLLGAEVTTPPVQSPVPFALRPEKPYAAGDPLDFDSVDDATLDRFGFVLTTSAAYAGTPPPNFRLVRETPSFKLWRRTGPTAPRAVLAEGSAPSAVLDCDSAAGRAAMRSGGSARVLGPARVVPGPAGGGVGAGYSVALPFRARAGTYDLSLQYTSPQPVVLRAPGFRAELPANLDGLGPYWPAGRITVERSGTVPLRVSVPRASPIFARAQFAVLRSLAVTAATPVRTMPLARACGERVDWYVPAGPS